MIDVPLVEPLRGLRRRTLRSRTLVDTLLARIDRHNPRLNMVLLRRDEALRAEADEADARLDRGDARGPLDGLPVSIKDSLDTSGIRTTAGCLHRASRVPDEDATTVHRLRSAGALVLLKSSLPELAFGLETANLFIGRTRNPWAPSRTVGGSSGGEAALIASGCSFLGLGSDFAGSLRLPAHFCGIASLKPTPGALPNAGHPPPIPDFMQPMAVIGPLARTAADLAVGWAALRQDRPLLDGLLERSAEVLEPPPSVIHLALRDDRHLSAPCREALDLAASTLARLGHRVERCEVPALLEAERLWEHLVVQDGGAGLRQLTDDGQPLNLWLELLRNLFGRGRRHADLLTVRLLASRWRALPPDEVRGRRAALLEQLEPYVAPGHALLMPVTPGVAHRAFNRSALLGVSRYVRGANVFGLPALTLPVRRGRPGVMPVGVQLMGGASLELDLLRLGAQLEAALDRSSGSQALPGQGWTGRTKRPGSIGRTPAEEGELTAGGRSSATGRELSR
jgi:Asp-tRNA(Asn)/Glu-tRNA(Gln) amidotransferase A subunit family amidase